MNAAAANSSVSIADAVSELLEEIGDINRRMSRMEAADPLADLVACVKAIDARMTGLERRFRRPPAFPITVISNEPPKSPTVFKPAEDPGGEMMEKVWQRLISAEVGQQLKPVFGDMTNMRGMVAEFKPQIANHDLTFTKMRTAFRLMQDRIAAVEARVAATTNPGGPTT
jgi:hypothetical protein